MLITVFNQWNPSHTLIYDAYKLLALPTAEFKNATFGAETSIKMSNANLEEFFRHRSMNLFQVELNDNNFATSSMLCFPCSKNIHK